MTTDDSRPSGAELMAARLDTWTAGDLFAFESDEAAEAYRERTHAIRAALELQSSERIAVCPTFHGFPMRHGGLTLREAMYDPEKAKFAYRRFHEEYLPDCLAQPMAPAAVWDALACRHIRWPGHGLPDDAGFQFVDAECMSADEYPRVIEDLSGFWASRYVPWSFDALSAWGALPPMTDLLAGDPASYLAFFGTDDGVASLRRLQAAGEAALAWLDAIVGMVSETVSALGIPLLSGGFVEAPYDFIANNLRGARGVMSDVLRRRESLAELCERLVPVMVERAVRTADTTMTPIVTIPLHWGSDGFMSDADYREVYWPSLKAVILGCLDSGVVPLLASEGSYNSRLEVIADADIPPGRTIWAFDATDLSATRAALAGKACVSGNLPIAMLCVADSQEVRRSVDRVFEAAGDEPGFIFGTGGQVDEARSDNVRAMMSQARDRSRSPHRAR